MYDVASWKERTFCAIRFGLSASDIGQYKLNRTCFAGKFVSSLSTGFMDRACFAYAYEVIAIREGQLTLMHDHFSGKRQTTLLSYVIFLCQ